MAAQCGCQRGDQEAGIGKGLLYNYFGGLPGLVAAWGERKQIWPSQEELIGPYRQQDLGTVDALDLIKTVVINHSRSLRDHPLRIELLADELMNPGAISEALSNVRGQMGRQHKAIFQQAPEMGNFDHRSLLLVMMAAASYVAMRATHAPRFMGEQLDTEDGWDHLMARFERIVDLVALGLKVEDLVGKTAAEPSAEPNTDAP